MDSLGSAYLVGNTSSLGFPLIGGPDLTYNGADDLFVAKVGVTGATLAYSGYLGGEGDDEGRSIALDRFGNAYLAGRTDSTEASFPVLVGPDLTYNGGENDAILVKVSASGALRSAGYLGGVGNDLAVDVAVDGFGNAYLTGITSSAEATFPATIGPDLTHNGGDDVFVAMVSTNAPPVARDDTATTPEGAPVTIDVVGNDSDPDLDTVLSVVAVGGPAAGTAVLSGTTTIVYTPAPDFSGVESFTYTLSDGFVTDTATVTVTVTPVYDLFLPLVIPG